MKSKPGTICEAQKQAAGLGEEILRVAIQDHLSDGCHRHQFFRHAIGGIQHVEAETLGLFLREYLQAEFVFRIGPRFNRLPQVAPVKVRVCARNLDGFVPGEECVPPVDANEISRNAIPQRH